MATPAITPEAAQAAEAAQDPTPQPDASQGDPTASGGDTGPLSSINLTPAENGGVIATHHKRVPERVKAMDHEDMKPRVHALKDHKEAEEHVKKHLHRLKP